MPPGAPCGGSGLRITAKTRKQSTIGMMPTITMKACRIEAGSSARRASTRPPAPSSPPPSEDEASSAIKRPSSSPGLVVVLRELDHSGAAGSVDAELPAVPSKRSARARARSARACWARRPCSRGRSCRSPTAAASQDEAGTIGIAGSMRRRPRRSAWGSPTLAPCWPRRRRRSRDRCRRRRARRVRRRRPRRPRRRSRSSRRTRRRVPEGLVRIAVRRAGHQPGPPRGEREARPVCERSTRATSSGCPSRRSHRRPRRPRVEVDQVVT